MQFASGLWTQNRIFWQRHSKIRYLTCNETIDQCFPYKSHLRPVLHSNAPPSPIRIILPKSSALCFLPWIVQGRVRVGVDCEWECTSTTPGTSARGEEAFARKKAKEQQKGKLNSLLIEFIIALCCYSCN